MQRQIRSFLPIALAGAFAGFCLATARADVVTDWNQIMFQAALVAKTSPLDMSRNAAIVQGAVYDAVNGIDRSYIPLHVKPAAPRRASPDAAAIQALMRASCGPNLQGESETARLSGHSGIISRFARQSGVIRALIR
jgi:hypothetical protein